MVDLPAGSLAHRAEQTEADDGEVRFVPLQAMVEEAERRHIQRALERAGGSVSGTAELLGISRKTLWEKMKRFKVKAVDDADMMADAPRLVQAEAGRV